MSKSLGNFFTLRDLLAQGWQPEAVRYLLASVPYRKQLNFTFDGLKAAATAIERLRNYKLRLETGRFPEGSNAALAERAAARPARFEEPPRRRSQHRRGAGRRLRIRARHQHRHGRGRVSRAATSPAPWIFSPASTASSMCCEPRRSGRAHATPPIEALIAERNAARKARDFARADQIRAGLLEKGVILEDTKDGVRWKRR